MLLDWQFCPVCHHKNKRDAEQCAFCATPLAPSSQRAEKTVDAVPHEDLALRKKIDCREIGNRYPADTLVLLHSEDSEPLIVHKVREVILGRSEDNSSNTFVDLTAFGAESGGVSREHVQISCLYSDWTILDLGSTNGTWLNRQRLKIGEVYELQEGDQLWLGPLRLTVCFGTLKSSPVQIMTLVDTAVPPYPAAGVAADYLSERIMPYLQAAATLQQIQDADQEEAEPFMVQSIQVEGATIQVQVAGLSDTVIFSLEQIAAWQEERQHGEEITEPELLTLAQNILAATGEGLPEELLTATPQDLLAPLSSLAASSLTCSVVKDKF